MAHASAGDLGAVLHFLRDPDAYPDRSASIDVVETHFSWVFLSARFAYKLSKPIRFHDIDFTTLRKRKANSERAVRLNGRLAPAVYIGAVPLTRADGRLELEGDGDPIEWLVKMHRLPRAAMLDSRLAAGPIERSELVPVVAKLAAFYRRSRAPQWDGERYASVLRSAILEWGEHLSAFPGEIDVAEADRLVSEQLGFVARSRSLLDARVMQGRVVDAHGDLRPEHVALSDDPQIIDCLEFSNRLRQLDSAEEIAGLALECARLGRDDVADRLVTAYRLESDDGCEPPLWAFYRSRQALRRALLSAWHLEDPMYATTERKWIDRTHWYLRAGRAALAGTPGAP